VFQPSDHFHGPPPDHLQQLHVFPVLRAPELDARTPGGVSPERRGGAESAGHAAFDTAEDVVGLLGCECTEKS